MHKQPILQLRMRAACAALAPALMCLAALAQDGSKPKLPDLGAPPGEGGGKKEMEQLFHKVERRLGEIDKLLYDASAGHVALQSQKESGIGDLIKASSSKSQEAIRDIDKILELAMQAGQMSPSQSGGKPKDPGDGQGQQQGKNSPLDGQQGQPTSREQTPEKPGGEKGPPKGQQGDKPDSSNSDNGQPKSPRDSNGEPENHPGGPPPKLETAKHDASQANERWGDLPVQVRELFRSEGGGEMPAQYRDWIDAYYRRLNQRP